jgi:D-serine deaminase-like pyridoxal phosphate-dependent protein
MNDKTNWSRRRFARNAALGGLGAAGLWALRPDDHGAPHDAYFAAIDRALKAAGIAMPTLVLDRARLQANATHLNQHVQGRMGLRLVNKSLPCMPLLDELVRLAGTQRQMVFNLPYLQLLARHQPQADILLGKPLPVAIAARFHASPPTSGFDASRQLQWLVDTPERLAQYRELARGQQRPMRINIEIDVGLHRGGVADIQTLQAMVDLLKSEPLLQWSGLMGYDAHTQKIPDVAGMRARAHRHALQTYDTLAAHMRSSGLALPAGQATFNTGGSLTYPLHDGQGAANEVAVGSALVKPSDFDTPLLQAMQPAAFIATPVLKLGPFRMPNGVEALSPLISAWDTNRQQGLFIHGGNWLARPVSPAGLSPSTLIGTSSNQQIFLASGRQQLKPDDFVFFRPVQSEAVLQQFGDIAVYEEGRITAMWPVFPAQV